MVARGRLLAIWFVSILVLSVLPGMAPSASAAVESSEILVKQGGNFVPVTGTIGPGQTIRFSLSGRAAGQCEGAITELDQKPASITVTVKTQGILNDAADATTTITGVASPTSQYNFYDTDDGRFQTNVTDVLVQSTTARFDNPAHQFEVTVTYNCPTATPSLTTPPAEGPTPLSTVVAVDTKRPTFTVTKSIVPGAGGFHPGGDVLNAGSLVTFTVSNALDERGLQGLTLDSKAINTTSGGVAAPDTVLPIPALGSSTTYSMTIDPSTAAGARVLESSNAQVVFRLRDASGNVAEQPVTFTIDNKLPATTLSYSGRSVVMRQTAGAGMAASTTVTPSWTPPADASKAEVYAGGTRQGTPVFSGSVVSLSAGNVGDGISTPLSVVLRPVDNAGNEGVSATASPPLTVPRLTGLTFGLNGGIPTLLPGNRLGNVQFTIADDVPSGSNYYGDVNMTVERVGKGLLIVGASGSDPNAHFAYDNKHHTFHAGPSTRSNSPSIAFTNLSSANLADGSYILTFTINGTSGNQLVQRVPFTVDSGKPTIANRAGTAATPPTIDPRSTGSVRHGMDGAPVDVGLTVADAGSGLQNVSVALLKLDGTQAKRADGTDARVDFSRAAACAPGGGLVCVTSASPLWGEVNWASDALLQGDVNLSMFGMPPGSYRVQVYAQDKAGNGESYLSPATPESVLFTVVPRAALVANEALPFAGTGKILVSGLAAVDLPAGADQSGKTCVADVGGGASTVCRVTSVTFYARNRNADGTLGEEKVLGPASINLVGIEPQEDVTVPLFNRPAHTFRMFNVTVAGGFDYPTGVVPTKTVQVRMKAVVAVGSATYEADTGWQTANSLTQPALSTTSFGLTGWKANTTGVVDYNVVFDLKEPGVPTLTYTLTRTPPGGSPVTLAPVGPSYPAATPAGGTVSFFNGTFGSASNPLPEGEYSALLEAYFGSVLKATATRTFTVVSTKPALTFEALPADANATRRPGTNIFDVGGTFNMTFRVTHGLLNLTDIGNFTFDLTRSVPRDGLGTVMPNGTGGAAGFRVDVIGHTPLDQPRRSQTDVTVQVKLPDNARDGDGFALRVNASTDGRWSPGAPADASWYVASAIATLKLDKAAPAPTVSDAATNATGDSPQLRVLGGVDDLGSGVESVEVRIVDLTNGRTLLWSNPSGPLFAAGETDASDAWATSHLVPVGTGASQRWLRNVKLVNGTGGHADWSVDQWDRPVLLADGSADPSGARWRPLSDELNNESLYRVDVRARDVLGQVSQQIVSREVRFDTRAPLIVGVDDGSGIDIDTIRPGEAGWHGRPDDAVFWVNASDDKCLKRVSLRGTDPAGNPFGPIDMRPVTPYTCTDALRGQPIGWTLSAREAPALADLVGTYRYYVEAQDATGLVARGPTSGSLMATLRVVDTMAPLVRYVNPDPPLIGEATSSAIKAEVFENHAIDKVEVFVGRMGIGSSVTPVANGTMHASGTPAANGTGLYVAETGADLGLSLTKGDYLVQVRARDAAGTCGTSTNPCALMNAILRVSDAAAPAITEEGPARVFVNATPTLAYRVTDRSVPESGVRVRVGNATANLALVNASILPANVGAGGARTGWFAAISPSGLANGEKLVVEVTAAGNLSATRTFNYTVDAAPPVLATNATGLVPIGDKQWATSLARVFVNASDVNGSGLASVRYLVNGAAVPATSPLTPSGNETTWTLDVEATDNASNVARARVALNLDAVGPSVRMSRHGDDVVLLVTDAGAGLDEGNVTVHYAYNGSSPLLSKKMERATGTANAFTASLGGNASAQGLRYWFEAKDKLGNVGRLYDAATPWVIPKDDTGLPPNTAPTVRILAPTAGAAVRGPVELRWTAFDNESQPLTVTLALQEPGKTSPRSLIAGAADNGTYTLDLTGAAAGTYRFTVVVSDGQLSSAQESRAFLVEAGKTVSVIAPIPATVEANKAATFQVQLAPAGKTVKSATFNVTRDGQPYASGTLRPAGAYHEGSVTPDGPGDYKVSVLVAYTDSTQDAPVQVASFSVAAPPEETSTPVSFIALLAVAALTVALAAYGAFGRWK